MPYFKALEKPASLGGQHVDSILEVSSRLCGLLLTPPNTLAGQRLIDTIETWHHYTSDTFDVFCLGYHTTKRYLDDVVVYRAPLSKRYGPREYFFSRDYFEDYLTEVESGSGWQHKAGELLLLNVVTVKRSQGTETSFNYDAALLLDLDSALENTGRTFSELLLEVEKASVILSDEPVSGLSDKVTVMRYLEKRMKPLKHTLKQQGLTAFWLAEKVIACPTGLSFIEVA